MLDFAHAFSILLGNQRANVLFAAQDSQTFIDSLGACLQTSLSEVQVTASQVTSELKGYPGRDSGGSTQTKIDEAPAADRILTDAKKKRAAVCADCMKDINFCLLQMGIMTNVRNVPSVFSVTAVSKEESTVSSGGQSSSSSSLLSLMQQVRDLLPMLVSEQRAGWDLANGLEEAQMHFPDALASLLIMLLFPLSRLCSSLHTRVAVSLTGDPLSVAASSLAPAELLVEAQRVHLGQAVIRITAQEQVSGDAMLHQTLQSYNRLSDLEESVVKALTSLALCNAADDKAVTEVWSKRVSSLCTKMEGEGNGEERDDTVQVEYCLMLPCHVTRDVPLHSQPCEETGEGAEGGEAVPLQVLVVDDCRMIQKVLGRFLKSKECVVTSAENGLVGFQKLAERCGDVPASDCCPEESQASSPAASTRCPTLRPFDVVFMDFLMPVMDGLQALRAIHTWRAQHPELEDLLRDLFVIGFSATAHSQEQDDAFGEPRRRSCYSRSVRCFFVCMYISE
jgi:CheY-like chemotaxis protein